jgi:hypothetical protein
VPADKESNTTTLAMTDHPSPSTQAESEILITKEGNNIIIMHTYK